MITGTRRRRYSEAPLAVVGTTAAYMAWLGWDQQRDLHADGSSTGPYQAWQVVGLVLTLGVLTWLVSRRRVSYLCCALITVTLTACFAIDAATDPDGDGLWIIGAALVFIGAALGTTVFAHVCAATRARLTRMGQTSE